MKKLIAAAVASAFIAPAAFAAETAAESNVTLYGSLRVFGNYVHAGDGYKNAFKVADGASRIGFMGADKITDDLSVIWQVESSVDVNGGKGSWSNRNSFVGLQGVLGTVRFGNFDTAYTLMDTTGPQAELFDNYGDTVDPKAAGGFYGRANARLKNSISYETPNLNGLVGRLSYGVDNNTYTKDHNNSWIGSASLTYSINGFNIGAAYQHAKNHSLLANRFNVTKNGIGIISGQVREFTDAQTVTNITLEHESINYNFTENGTKSDAIKVAVNYQFDTGLNIGLGWERLEDKNSALNGKQDTFFAGANLPVGQWLLQAGYGYANKLKTNGLVSPYVNNGGKAQMALLGSQYALSKRSRVYSYLSWVDNKNASAFTVGNDMYAYNNGGNSAVGQKNAYAVSVGFRTDF